MESNLAALPIELKQLEQYAERAGRLLVAVKWTPKESFKAETPSAGSETGWRESGVAAPSAEELSIIRAARLISRDPVLLAEEVNHTLLVVQRGLCLGMYLGREYTKASALDQLVALNSRGALAEAQKGEFRAKYLTAAAVTIFSASYYISWELSRYKTEELSALDLDFAGIPEMALRDPVSSVDCLMYYYAAYLSRTPGLRATLDFVKLSSLYFSAAVDEIQLRAAALQYPEPFSGQCYKLEQSEFSINGFTVDRSGVAASIEFNRVELGAIVGNREAKHDARRLVSRLLCYDLAAKRNPMLDLGGLSLVTMGYGEPGTGKSMLISAVATMLYDYCAELKIPFLFWPLPDTVVSTFQGGSAERMLNWMRALRDPGRIIYAPIDDAENNLEDRSRQGVSAGVREVIAVFLRNTEGAYAVTRGNAVIQLFTNLPEQIDKAVLSRIGARAYIGGAATLSDFIDQDYLWQRKYRELDGTFINLQDPPNYTYLADQALLKFAGEMMNKVTEPAAERARAIYEAVKAEHGLATQLFFAEFYRRLKESFPAFSSRDLRNIQRAVDGRILDFDLPAEWLEQPDLFFRQDYDTKKAMLRDLMRQNLQGLSFAELRWQETIRYIDNFLRIADTERERRLGQLVQELELRRAAEERCRR